MNHLFRLESKPDKPLEPNSGYSTVIDGANYNFYFLELANEYTGDSAYIKAGDNNILIDADSRKNGAPVIKRYLDYFVTDGKLEYVIATHTQFTLAKIKRYSC